jgi:hypothetical protein
MQELEEKIIKGIKNGKEGVTLCLLFALRKAQTFLSNNELQPK